MFDLVYCVRKEGVLRRLSPLMFAINTKIAPGGQFRPPLYFKCMTKEEIIARKNILRAMGKDIQVDESWGPNLERLW